MSNALHRAFRTLIRAYEELYTEREAQHFAVADYVRAGGSRRIRAKIITQAAERNYE